MKKKLESELISIAHRILKLTGKEDIDKMHKEVAQLYEKLTVLKFAQEHFEEDMPTITNDSSFFGMLDTAFNNTVSDTIEIDDKTYVNVDERDQEGITEPLMTTIKDMVAQMPEPTDFTSPTQEPSKTTDTKNITYETISSDFANIPEFEPIEVAQKRNELQAKKSLNDKLKGNGLQIGLNDKLAFIKHLFDGKIEDYDRVISQINTLNTIEDTRSLINTMIKPDYNNWEGKEDYAIRFLELIEAKFN